MRGVDKGNQLIIYYELSRGTNKWWKRIFLHLIDISIVNSFIIWKKSELNKGMTQKQFRLEIVRSIIKKYDISTINKKIFLMKQCIIQLDQLKERHARIVPKPNYI